MVKKSFIVILCLISNLDISGQCYITSKGKEFWVGFLENYAAQGGLLGNDSLKIFVSSNINTSGTVTIPLQAFTISFTVAANTTVTIDIPFSLAQNDTSEIIEDKGVLVQTQDTVSVFAQHASCNTDDATLVLPTPMLGTDYRIMAYRGYQFNSFGSPSEFVIAATQDNTQIQITPSVATIGGNPANITFTITLNKGQTYQVQTLKDNLDFTGSTIVETSGSKPISVFSGSMCTRVDNSCMQACDHLYEQDLPTDKWGTEFHVIPFKFHPGTNKDRYTYRILAHKNGTVVTINGGAPVNLSAGAVYEQNQVKNPLCVSSNKPINVTQYMESFDCGPGLFDSDLGDPAMLILNSDEKKMKSVVFKNFPTINSTIFDTVTHTQANDTVIINVLMETAYINQLKLDGVFINPGQFTPFTSCSNYSYIQKPLVTGNHTLSADSGFIAYVYGRAAPTGPESFALALGFDGTISPVKISGNVSVCQGSSTIVTIMNGWDYSWNPSAGISSINNNTVAASPTVTTTYTVTGTNICGTSYGIIKISLFNLPTVFVSSNVSICPGQSTLLFAFGAANYMWQPSIGLLAASSVTASPLSTTTYTLTGTDMNGCTDTAKVTVAVGNYFPPLVAISPDVSICPGQSVELSATGAITFMWSPAIAVTASDGSSANTSPSSTITYTVTGIDTSGCFSVDFVKVAVYAFPTVDAGEDIVITLEESKVISVSSGAIGYLWTPDTGLNCNTCKNPMASPINTTTYYVTVTDAYGCINNDSIKITVLPHESLYIPNSFTPNGDGKNEMFYVYGSRIKNIDIKIFNRWGELLFTSTSIQEGWDGTYKNQLSKEDVYICLASCTWESGASEVFRRNINLVK